MDFFTITTVIYFRELYFFKKHVQMSVAWLSDQSNGSESLNIQQY